MKLAITLDCPEMSLGVSIFWEALSIAPDHCQLFRRPQQCRNTDINGSLWIIISLNAVEKVRVRW